MASLPETKPPLTLIVPGTTSQGYSTASIGVALLLSELQIPFSLKFVPPGPNQLAAAADVIAKQLASAANPPKRLPILLSPAGAHAGAHEIMQFVKKNAVGWFGVDEKIVGGLTRERELEGNIGGVYYGNVEADHNKLLFDLTHIVAHGKAEAELPAWIDLIHLLCDLDNYLSARPSPDGDITFLNSENPSTPSALDCFMIPILYETEVALRTFKKWDMERDHKFTHIRRYLDSFLARPSWAAAQVSEAEVVEKLKHEHDLALEVGSANTGVEGPALSGWGVA